MLIQAIRQHGVPEYINSDQGVQYTSKLWIDTCISFDIKISMDGRARCLDNVWIERFWRTIKREYIYIHPEDSVRNLRIGIRDWLIIKHLRVFTNSRPD